MALIFLVAATLACSGKSDIKASENVNATLSTTAAAGCDKTLWDHVYNPSRLEVQADCVSVTGIIAERDSNEDGDEHMLLFLSPGQDLINKRNEKKKEGALVIEAVCAHPPDDKKAKDACRNFSNTVYLPKVGEHVRVTGSYVIDSHNGWAEIHPISKIEKVDQ